MRSSGSWRSRGSATVRLSKGTRESASIKINLRNQRQVIGGRRRGGVRHDLAAPNTIRKPRGREEVVEPYVRRPRRKRVADIGPVQQAVCVDVSGVEHQLNRAPPDMAAAQPDERAQAMRQFPEIEQIARRERVEISGEQVEAMLMASNARKQRAKLDHPVALRPCGVERAQMD